MLVPVLYCHEQGQSQTIPLPGPGRPASLSVRLGATRYDLVRLGDPLRWTLLRNPTCRMIATNAAIAFAEFFGEAGSRP